MEFSAAWQRATWLILIASQLWLVYRFEQRDAAQQTPLRENEVNLSAPAVSSAMSQSAVATPAATRPTAGSNDLYAVLQRIESRLAQLERQSAHGASPQPRSETREPSARERAEADQRLSHMLPSGTLSREDVARFHADIQSLPPDERFAMATALARAINEGRVQPGPAGL